jgi:hypothetical protein
MNGELLMEGFRSLQLVLEKKQPLFSKEMLYVENEEDLAEEQGFTSAITGTSYDALTPLSIARLHESKQDLRRTQESLRQAQLLSKLKAPETKGQQNNVYGNNKDKEEDGYEKDATKDNFVKSGSTHSVLMEHAARPVSTLASSFQVKKMSRREQILALFVRGVDVSIKDISARIKGCSEKTIQRELNTLLYDNVIERIGEKRWSRYILK